ncbi:MAG: helix-turn-helix domain-containing protein [Nitrososphaeraceae archaeon]
MLALLRKSEGRTYLDIAKEHGVSSRSVQRWIAAYLKKGIDGLRNKKSGGAKSRITDEHKEGSFFLPYLMTLIPLVILEIHGV